MSVFDKDVLRNRVEVMRKVVRYGTKVRFFGGSKMRFFLFSLLLGF